MDLSISTMLVAIGVPVNFVNGPVMSSCANCEQPLQENAILCINCGWHMVESRFVIEQSGQSNDDQNPYDAPEDAGAIGKTKNAFPFWVSLHIGTSFLATLIGFLLFGVNTSQTIAPVAVSLLFARQLFAPELFVPALLLGAVFAQKTFPLCGLIGMLPAYLIGLLMFSGDNLIPSSPLGLCICTCLALAFPGMAELAGHQAGAFVKKNIL